MPWRCGIRQSPGRNALSGAFQRGPVCQRQHIVVEPKRHRLCDTVALGKVDADTLQLGEHLCVLHKFSDGLFAHHMANAVNRLDHCRIDWIIGHVSYKRAVDLEHCSGENALRIAEDLRHTINERPFIWQSRSFSIGVSVGLVSFETQSFTLGAALSAADSACYMAKEKGRNRVQLYRSDDAELSSRKGEMEWVGRIQSALDEDRFCLYAQDIVPVAQGAFTGKHVELLVRMLDKDGKMISPLAFIPAAERYNLMPAIDRWVVRTGFRRLAQLRELRQWGAKDLCAINLSAASLGEESTFEFIVKQFEECAIPYSSVCFELTETAAISIIAKAAQFMHELRALGCRFALDDFGAGMSSFAYLKHLPVDLLK